MNKAMLMGVLALGVSCSYRMGRALPTDPALAAGNIHAASSVQGAEQLVSSAFVRELTRRSGGGEEQTVSFELLYLEDRPTASNSRLSRIRMAIALTSSETSRIEVAGVRVYSGSEEAVENAIRRDHALSSLTTELVQEGLPQLSMMQQDN